MVWSGILLADIRGSGAYSPAPTSEPVDGCAPRDAQHFWEISHGFRINFSAIPLIVLSAPLTAIMSLSTGWIRRRITWLTLCAVLFGLVAPSIAHGLAAITGRVWVEVCSVAGTRRVVLDADTGQTPTQVKSSADCPFCLLQGDSPAPAETSRLVGVEPAVEVIVSLPGLIRPRSVQFVWAAHYTRAPPFFS